MVEFERRVGPKGQVVIPKEIRRAAGIRPASHVLVTMQPDRSVLIRQHSNPDEWVEWFERRAKSHAGHSRNVNLEKILDEELEKICPSPRKRS
jgi:AbrB family looped-hinge helix DNA binding protein